eukprot:GHVN01068229.1.p2 GENE.GHVN01068229.1~~GHVN01068229.1.p2  ORF type:complete len:542 (-),score=57.30 GHVN01068229.1:4029-5432(-)
MASAPDAVTKNKFLLEHYNYVPVRHHMNKLEIGAGSPRLWKMTDCQSDHYCRVVKDSSDEGWSVVHEIAGGYGPVQAIGTESRKQNDDALWKAVRVVGGVKETLQITIPDLSDSEEGQEGEFVVMSFRSDQGVLLDSDDTEIIRRPTSEIKTISQLLSFKVVFEEHEGKHRILLNGKKLALEKTSQPNGTFPLKLIDDREHEEYQDTFTLRMNRKTSVAGIHPFVITAEFKASDGKECLVMVNNNGENGSAWHTRSKLTTVVYLIQIHFVNRFEGEVLSQPTENNEFYLVLPVTKNADFNEEDVFMFENKKEHGWLGVGSGTGSSRGDWAGMAPLADVNRKDVHLRVQSQSKGHWIVYAPDAATPNKELVENKDYVPVRHHMKKLDMKGGDSVAWKLTKCRGDRYCRVEREGEERGWSLVHRVAGPAPSSVSAIGTVSYKYNDDALWKVLRILGGVKNTLNLTSEDF